MGNDGGSIPTRRELVKEAARNPNTTQLKETLREHLEHFWTTCPISHKKLLSPVVSDAVGNLYNKDAILQYLLPGDDSEAISAKADCDEVLQGRVKSLRDVVELKFDVDGNLDVPNGGRKGRWICPVTQKELGPKIFLRLPNRHTDSSDQECNFYIATQTMHGNIFARCGGIARRQAIPIFSKLRETRPRLPVKRQAQDDINRRIA
ncbi:hypothetical protein TESG_02184 [Trichophyton tonsurans CBS 112818]|uniref:Uncharacterized protein n=1 Tax=Trichophyton tonsurans (strain CBS 112818) TaxID=647933 RepID=F2RTM7_TRIT1|nr:hypothetical protein TESG_02184 [Trichophyton tonsurans CBS 112818]